MLTMSNEIRSNTVPQSPMNNKNPALTNKVLDSPLRDILPRP
jgi:retinoblastoma-associated protein